MNVEYRMSVQEYEELTPYAGDLVENWGKAPGHLNSDGQNLLVFGCKFGNVFIGVQPTFGYEVGYCRKLFHFFVYTSLIDMSVGRFSRLHVRVVSCRVVSLALVWDVRESVPRRRRAGNVLRWSEKMTSFWQLLLLRRTSTQTSQVRSCCHAVGPARLSRPSQF